MASPISPSSGNDAICAGATWQSTGRYSAKAISGSRAYRPSRSFRGGSMAAYWVVDRAVRRNSMYCRGMNNYQCRFTRSMCIIVGLTARFDSLLAYWNCTRRAPRSIFVSHWCWMCDTSLAGCHLSRKTTVPNQFTEWFRVQIYICRYRAGLSRMRLVF